MGELWPYSAHLLGDKYVSFNLSAGIRFLACSLPAFPTLGGDNHRSVGT